MYYKKITFIIFILASFSSLTLSAKLETKEYYIPSDDVTIYCKEYGSGTPLFLLHGAMVTMSDWENQIPALSTKFRVICIDSRGHGKSSFTDKEITYHMMAEDMINIMNYLKIDSANYVGFGDGGNIVIQLAMEHPEKIIKMAVINSNLKPTPDAVYPYFLQKVKDWDISKMTQVVKDRFVGNPNPDLLEAFVVRMQYMLLHEPNYEVSDLKNITIPTLVMASDYGLVTVKHALSMFENLVNSFLCIIPGAKHYCIKEQPKLVNETLLNFFTKPFERVERY
ncbi:MAG: alpha/beta hydrolase [Bacteroidota bacterium]